MTMLNKIMMSCGCAANAVCSGKLNVIYDPPVPSCAVHDCIEISKETPDISFRRSKCGSCGSIKNSDFNLPFFQFRGKESAEATHICKNCNYYDTAHNNKNIRKPHPVEKCKKFEPVGSFEFDMHYDGCRGWD